VTGPTDLGTKFAPVENGKIQTTFTTSEALTGEYTVEADDGESHKDTTTVNIVLLVRITPSPTPVPTLTPTPSSAVPLFEAVLVVTALMVVCPFFVCVTRRRRK